MKNQELLNTYFEAVFQTGVFAAPISRLQFKLKTLFHNIDFAGKRVLEIGGGNGMYSYYAACMGAKDVLLLEPEADGSRSGVLQQFQAMRSFLPELSNLHLEAVPFQEFNSTGRQFDLILLYNSVNHLDEQACIHLLEDEHSRKIYLDIFSKIYSLAHTGVQLLICDCSRYNFFPLLGMRNPIDPSIEWHKHHTPHVWIELLSQVGFGHPTVRWSSFNPLYTPGKILFGNKIAAFFLLSHFYLTMKKLSDNSRGFC